MTNKKVIFNILPSYKKGGAEKMFLYYSEILQKDYEIYAIVPHNFKYYQELEHINVKFLNLDIKGHYDLVASWKFLKLLKTYQPELLICHSGRALALCNLVKKFFINKSNFPKTLAISHGGSVKRINGFDYALGVADHISKRIKDNCQVSKIFTLTNFIKRNKINASKNNDPDNISFGIISRIAPEKNIELALQAIAQLKKPQIKLKIFGDGESLTMLQNLTIKLKIANQVEFMGWSNDLTACFKQFDIMLLPSNAEPFGLVILEAFDHHIPVIASNSAGPAEIITHGHDGLLFKMNDASDLAQKMLSYLEQTELRDATARNAEQSLEQKYSFTAASKNLKNIIQEILA